MDCRVVSLSVPGIIMAMALLYFMVFSHVCGANMVFNLKHKFENMSSAEIMDAQVEHETRRRGRSLSAIDMSLGAMLYSGFAVYYAQVVIGDPPKSFYPQLSPSTGMMWFYCNGCKRCPTTSSFKFDINKYEVNDSSTGKILECADKMCGVTDNDKKEKTCADKVCKYKLDISSGNMIKDTFKFNTVTGDRQTTPAPIDLVFGCGFEQYNGLEGSEWAFDGTLGLAMSNLTMLSQLVASKHVKKNTWSHCFKRGTKGGVLAFGEVEMQKDMKMTPLLQRDFNQQLYEITLMNFSIGGKQVALDKNEIKGTMVDISSVYNYFPGSVYKVVMDELHSIFKDLKFSEPNPFSCFLYSGRIDHDFPIITYTFEGGVEMKIHPNQYIFERSPDQWCIAIMNSREMPPVLDYFVVAESTIEERLVVYDLDNKKMGWADYDCDKGIKVIDDETGKAYVVSAHSVEHDTNSAETKVGGAALLNLILCVLLLSYLAL